MIRFQMPHGALPVAEKKRLLREQFDTFTKSEAMQELLSLLDTDIEDLPRVYGSRRKASGGVMETQDMKAMPELEEHRQRMYPLLVELGFIDINTPLKKDHTRIAILGGAAGACFDRVRFSARFASDETECVDALTCFRSINPVERVRSGSETLMDTEFGVMTEALTSVYELDASRWKDDFDGDRNINSISCCRRYEIDEGRNYRVFAAPSSQPRLRRADTGDCLCDYLDKTSPCEKDSILAITSNRYRNRQFIQIAYEMIEKECPAYFDIIGCRIEDTIDGVDTYDPIQYLQDLIGILDWIEKFD